MIRVINEVNGFDQQIGHLVAMMSITRSVTIQEVMKLSVKQLDFNDNNRWNSIGTLLKHIAALETWYYNLTFNGRDLNSAERIFWQGALPGELDLGLIKGNDIHYYLECLHNIRSQTIKELQNKEDEWLYVQSVSGSNNYYKWFHVMEDEISHRGQIKWIKARFPSSLDVK
ncbi:hypothetical protein GCM10011506_45270 [Marivirga lumbricoides]|uniref:DinB family protein n=1 Tax=Marivirga lumbricoides TaxID=1046115 RepID=A0ABQ1NCJ4_9BACT|nr:hypothetical protein GCM10011506_45270 [Marivirga lumbricoides]